MVASSVPNKFINIMFKTNKFSILVYMYRDANIVHVNWYASLMPLLAYTLLLLLIFFYYASPLSKY